MEIQTLQVVRQYDLIPDLLDTDMLRVYVDILRSENLIIQKVMTDKFGYLALTDT